MTDAGGASALLVTTLVYAVSISAFVTMALSLAIDIRSALLGMGSFLGVFLITRLLSMPPTVQFAVPLLAGLAAFFYRSGLIRGELSPDMLGRSIGKLMVGLLSAVSLVSGLFILVLFYRSGAFSYVLAESGPGRAAVIVALEVSPVLAGAAGLGLLYWANR